MEADDFGLWEEYNNVSAVDFGLNSELNNNVSAVDLGLSEYNNVSLDNLVAPPATKDKTLKSMHNRILQVVLSTQPAEFAFAYFNLCNKFILQ